MIYATLSTMIIYLMYVNVRANKEVKHRDAIINVLRWRLGDVDKR